MGKGRIYREEDYIPVEDKLERIEQLCNDIIGDNTGGIAEELRTALDALRGACKANKQITRGTMKIGFGIDKAEKAIACDTVIAILRQIKSLPSWS
jgi:hypothetical protein